MKPSTVTRRRFLQTALRTAGLTACPGLLPARILGQANAPAPSNRVSIGCIGLGIQGIGNLKTFLGHPGARVIAVRGRTQPAAPIEASLRSDTICHLAQVAIKRQRPLRWSPERESFLDDEEANRLLDRPMRAPWKF